MIRYKLVVWSWMVCAAAMQAAAASGRYPISADRIAATMSGRLGAQIAPEQVTLLTDVFATTAAPMLKIRSIQPWGNQRVMARLECESADQCLPFFVGVQVGQPDGAQAQAVALSSAKSSIVVRSGTPATLQLDGGRVHIRLAVICLENGAPGQTIRVTSKDRKQVYRAQVVDGTLLKGTL